MTGNGEAAREGPAVQASTAAARRGEEGGPYLVFMLVLSVLALGLLGVTVLVPLPHEVRSVLDKADVVVCGLFLLDFLISLARAPNRWQYVATWGWLDLLSSIPAVDALRIGRAGRVLRILRVLRGIRSAKVLADFLLRRRAEGAFLAASLVSVLLVFLGSVAVLHFETVPEANIKTAEDAVWWAFVTITTVGYGDRFPVTTEGRLVAAALMTAGVGLFGTFSGCVAAWFLKPQEARGADELEALRGEVRRLAEELHHDRRPEPGP